MAEITEVWNTNHAARFVGSVSDKGFLIHIKRHSFDNFRPRIRGTYTKGADNADLLTVHLEFKKQPVITLAIFLSFILVMGLIKSSIYSIHIVITSCIFFYLLGWALYQIDLNKTKAELEYPPCKVHIG